MASLSICVFSSLASVGKIQSCQILPVGNGLSDTVDTIWWNRLLGGLKTDGTTFGWTPGDQRADVQLAPSRVLEAQCWAPCCLTFSSAGW